jgi:hypothetical protein
LSFADRFKRFFRGPGRKSPALAQLEPFALERKGVEGFIEPQTATQPITLLLVDRDGDSARAPVDHVNDAYRFCEGFGIPAYDAAVVGYPRRMREFEAGRRSDTSELDARIAELERSLQQEPPTQP